MANYFGGYQPQQYQQNNNVTVVPVQGEQGASMYPVAAGNTCFLIDFALKKFWIKATDINGFPSKFAAFNFTEEVAPQNDASNFVSRTEFNDWKNGMDAQLTKILESITAIGGRKDVSAITQKPATVQTTV